MREGGREGGRGERGEERRGGGEYIWKVSLIFFS